MSDSRTALANQYLSGFGVEIGAGLSPTTGDKISDITFIDKRTLDELATLFGRVPDYELLTVSQAQTKFPKGVDFVVAHHVIEHCDNPLHVVANEWLPLLRQDGVLYLSLPSAKNGCEDLRIPTPIEHILDDFMFLRTANSYETKDHIYSFILQWTALSPDNFSYAKDGVQSFTSEALREVLRESHDLHWHTYTLPVATQMVEAAFHVAGAGIEWLCQRETEDELHLICHRRSGVGEMPDFLRSYRDSLLAAAARVTPLPTDLANECSLMRQKIEAFQSRILPTHQGLRSRELLTGLVRGIERVLEAAARLPRIGHTR